MSALSEWTENLPPEPSQAIIALSEALLRDSVRSASTFYSKSNLEDYRSICIFMQKFCHKYGIPGLVVPKDGPEKEKCIAAAQSILNNRVNILNKFIEEEVDNLLSRYDDGGKNSFGVAVLNDEEKRKIQAAITRIRNIVQQSDLTSRKKNALLQRLSDLSREVDLHGTRTDRFFAFAGDAAFVVGDMAEKAKPFIKEVKEVLKILSRSRARQEGISLPPGDEPLQLPSPPDQVEEI